MGSYLKNVSLYMGERESDDVFYSKDMRATISELAGYFSARQKTVSYGCGHSGYAAHFRQEMAAGGGIIEDVLPDFFADRAQRYEDLQRMKLGVDFYQAAGAPNAAHLENIDAVLQFKRNFLRHGGLKCVLPGYIGTLSELTLSLEENDSAVRFGLDVPLRPIIVLNVPYMDGSGAYDPYIELLERPIIDGRVHENRRNLVKFVPSAEDFVALFEAYEVLGPVMARDIDKFTPRFRGRDLDGFDAGAPFIPNLY